MRKLQHRFAAQRLSRQARHFYIERFIDSISEITMPTLVLKITSSPAFADHAALASTLTDITSEVLGKRREVTAVLVEEISTTRWFIGSQMTVQPTAWLEISITAGTNSEQQKQAFVGAAWQALDDSLGAGAGLHPTSYVIVRELPPEDWGYGGLTQKARQLQRAAAVQPK